MSKAAPIRDNPRRAFSNPMTPDQYCEDRAARSGSSFYYSFRFLEPERRRAITALYAFCREVDDIADDVADRNVALAKLGWWRAEIANLFAGHPTHKVTQALQPAIAAYGVDAGRLNEIIDGMEMDLTHHRYSDFESLKLYCHRVAGVVGQLSAGIFGFRSPSTLEYADNLGLAFQLTNIIRDVGEDARRGRIYLPAEDLRRFGVEETALMQGEYSAAFEQMMQFQAERARAHYAKAMGALATVDRKAQRPGLMMSAIYLALLVEIEHEKFRVLHQRISLTPLRKLWLAWKTWVGT